MPTFEVFSERQWRKSREGKPVVYEYDRLPTEFCFKVTYILSDALGPISQDVWDGVRGALVREKGLPVLGYPDDPSGACIGFIENPKSPPILVLDLIEIAFHLVDSEWCRALDSRERVKREIQLLPDQAIDKLNASFQRHDLGYQFAGGLLIRVDSFFAHSDIVEPAIELLYDEGFEGPLREFMEAHAHYRHRQISDAVVDANNAFESTIKSICHKRGITLSRKDKPDDLIRLAIGIVIPKQMEASLTALRATMQALPTLRSHTPGAGHGRGLHTRKVADFTAAYALHLCAANIIFLIEGFRPLQEAEVSGH
jgi:hypothetical protein